jgi:hypothetical protein
MPDRSVRLRIEVLWAVVIALSVPADVVVPIH